MSVRKAKRQPAGARVASMRRAPGVRLAVEQAEDGSPKQIPETKWIHLASEGEYLGHHQGPFALTREVFEAFVANFRASPQYEAGNDGVGIKNVVPFDYEHASELSPTQGTIPQEGAPAPAWLREIEVRDGPEGEAQLWGLTKFGKKVRSQIATEEYQWVSIAFGEGVDWKTGEDVGPVITSVAFTNHPFMRDLTPLAASRRALGFDAWQARDLEDAFGQLRRCLGLPVTSTVDDVETELGTILNWAAAESAPAGVDVDGLLGAIKTIFGLPVTADLATISDAVGKAVAALVSMDPQGSEATGLRGTDRREPPTMNLTQRLTKILAGAKLRKVRVLQSEDDVVAAVEETVAGSGDLEALLEAMGVADVGAAMKALPELRAAQTKIGELQKQLDDLLSVQTEIDQAQAASDVDAAIAAKAWPAKDDGLRKALSTYRDKLVKDHGRKKGRELFLTEHSVPEADRAYLLSTLVAAPGGRQVHAPDQRDVQPLRIVPRDAEEGGGSNKIDLRGLPGRNTTERLMSFLRSSRPELEKADHGVVFNAARALRRDNSVQLIDVDAAS